MTFTTITRSIAWMVLGAVIALAGYFALPAATGQASSWTYVWWGTWDPTPVCEPWYQIPGWGSCWHTDEPATDPWTGSSATYRAIDYNGSVGDGNADAGTEVAYYSNGQVLWRVNVKKIPSWWINCTGRTSVKLYNTDPYVGGYYYAGDLHYLHIYQYPAVENLWTSSWVVDIGYVLGYETCSWTAAHLHQSANTAYWTPLYSNSSRFNGYYDASTWEHKIRYP